MTWAERVMESWTTTRIECQTTAQRALVDWLSRDRWDVFWTQTFRHRTSAFGAQAKWLRCLAEFNLRTTVRAAMWAVEPHANFPSHHVHALLSTQQPTPLTQWPSVYRYWKEHWWRSVGKCLLLQTFPTTSCWYVVKYVNKRPKATWTNSTHILPWGILTGTDIRGLMRKDNCYGDRSDLCLRNPKDRHPHRSSGR